MFRPRVVYALLAGTIGFVGGMSFEYARKHDVPFADWAPNIATEAISIGITVFVVDYLIRWRERERIRPRFESAMQTIGTSLGRIADAVRADYIAAHCDDLPQEPRGWPPPGRRKDDARNIEALEIWGRDHDREPERDAPGAWTMFEVAETRTAEMMVVVDRSREILDPGLVTGIEVLEYLIRQTKRSFEAVQAGSVPDPVATWQTAREALVSTALGVYKSYAPLAPEIEEYIPASGEQEPTPAGEPLTFVRAKRLRQPTRWRRMRRRLHLPGRHDDR